MKAVPLNFLRTLARQLWVTKEELDQSERRILDALTTVERKIVMKQQDLAAAIQKIDDQLDKAKTEITNQIQALKDALTNTELPPEAQAAIDRLSALAQALDDVVPDAPPAEAPPPA